MCLYLKSSKIKPEPLIAKRDIYCLKAVDHYNEEKNICFSFYRSSLQRVGELMESQLGNPQSCIDKDLYKIEKGLHAIVLGSYLNSGGFATNTTIMLAKIPKGSKYYKGINGDIVADQMILIEPLVSNRDLNNLSVKIKGVMSIRPMFAMANNILKEEGYKVPNKK